MCKRQLCANVQATNSSHMMSMERCSYISQLNLPTMHCTFANNPCIANSPPKITKANRFSLTARLTPPPRSHHRSSPPSPAGLVRRLWEMRLPATAVVAASEYCPCGFFSIYFTPAFWSDLEVDAWVFRGRCRLSCYFNTDKTLQGTSRRRSALSLFDEMLQGHMLPDAATFN
jgi:hypothetical protein